MNMRLRRLENDYEEVKEFLRDHPAIRLVKTEGEPPEKYQFEFRIKGVEKKGAEVVDKDNHLAEIVLTLDYPGQEPICRMLTPVFHPNIDPHLICITDRWAAGESLTDVVVRIGRMLGYQIYNIKSPRNGEAAQWAAEHLVRFPLDAVDLAREQPARTRSQEPTPAAKPLKPVRSSGPSKPNEVKPSSAAAPPVDVKRPVPENVTLLCANCKTPTNSDNLKKCRNGHGICPECSFTCRVCGAVVCVLCDLTRCSTCRSAVCPGCLEFCHFHRQPVCRDHLVVCRECGIKGCDQCLSLCPGCGNHFCRTHFDKGRNLCAACQKTDTPPPPSCPYCGKLVPRKGAKFCPACGQKL